MRIPRTKKTIAGAAIGTLALLGGGLTVANAATGSNGGGDRPAITGTIPAPPETDGPDTPQAEQAETDQLTALATLTPEQAKAAAEKAVGGTATRAEIDEEDGFVVYEVDVITPSGQVEVTVDAGSGAVLAQDADDDGPDGTDNESDETADGSNGTGTTDGQTTGGTTTAPTSPAP